MKDPRNSKAPKPAGPAKQAEQQPASLRFVEDAGLGLVNEDFGKAPETEEGETDEQEDGE